MKNKEVIWKVDVSDEFLTFTKVPIPNNFFEVAEEQEYNDFNGIFCGHRGYYDDQFKLHRKLKSSDYYKSVYKDEFGNFSLRKWREAYGFSYAWEPQYYYKYNGDLYVTGVNFR